MTKRRKQSIEFHIAVNDYFGTLATLLDLMRQTFEERGFTQQDSKTLEQLKDDLMYLQENHSIE